MTKVDDKNLSFSGAESSATEKESSLGDPTEEPSVGEPPVYEGKDREGDVRDLEEQKLAEETYTIGKAESEVTEGGAESEDPETDNGDSDDIESGRSEEDEEDDEISKTSSATNITGISKEGTSLTQGNKVTFPFFRFRSFDPSPIGPGNCFVRDDCNEDPGLENKTKYTGESGGVSTAAHQVLDVKSIPSFSISGCVTVIPIVSVHGSGSKGEKHIDMQGIEELPTVEVEGGGCVIQKGCREEGDFPPPSPSKKHVLTSMESSAQVIEQPPDAVSVPNLRCPNVMNGVGTNKVVENEIKKESALNVFNQMPQSNPVFRGAGAKTWANIVASS
ncbi:hypothetical protein U1Q18_014635, partial [Sarracenia purpurea var. burkii]